MSEDPPEKPDDFADGKTAWKPRYSGAKGARTLHAEAYRARAGMIGLMQACICAWPLVVELDTLTGHSRLCPTDLMAPSMRQLWLVTATLDASGVPSSPQPITPTEPNKEP